VSSSTEFKTPAVALLILESFSGASDAIAPEADRSITDGGFRQQFV
jgi:hypothetical protein